MEGDIGKTDASERRSLMIMQNDYKREDADRRAAMRTPTRRVITVIIADRHGYFDKRVIFSII
jgi:hypothetical protein